MSTAKDAAAKQVRSNRSNASTAQKSVCALLAGRMKRRPGIAAPVRAKASRSSRRTSTVVRNMAASRSAADRALVSFREIGLVRVVARRAKPNHAGTSIVCLSVSIARSSASISTA